MKSYFSALIIAAGLFATTTSSAQMSYGRARTNTMGMDRNIGINQYYNGKKKPTDKVNLLEESLIFLEKELTLDSFQKAVIKEMLDKNNTEETKVLSEDLPEDSKLEKFTILRQKLDENIKKILNKDQVDLFVKLKDKLDKNRS